MDFPPYPSIGDYAAIGDCRCLGLISRQGSLDWLCLPRFDSPAVFGALLDAEKGGRFAIRPVATSRITRSYLENTNVLETVFATDSGEVRLTDFMPVGHHRDYQRKLWPERYLLRVVECLAGEVEMDAFYEPRPQFGKHAAILSDRGRLGVHYEHRGQSLNLLSDFPLLSVPTDPPPWVGKSCAGASCLAFPWPLPRKMLERFHPLIKHILRNSSI